MVREPSEKKSPKRQEQRDAIIRALADHVLQAGLGETSLRQLASAAGVSNRMLLYYFKDKAEVLYLTLMQIVTDLAELAGATREGGRLLTPSEAFDSLADLSRDKALRPYMTVWIEISAKAARGHTPYVGIAAEIAQRFISWLEASLDTEDPKQRKLDAAMILSMVDGLTLLSMSVKTSQIRAAQKKMAALLR